LPMLSLPATPTPHNCTLSLHDALPICPRGLEVVLADELREIAAQSPTLQVHGQVPGGVHCSGQLSDAWRINLHTRIASRVLLRIDRKSTRLNSSHVKISYAVFRLKKKK